MNITRDVNTGRGYESALERDLARVLAELLSSAPWLQRWRIRHNHSRYPEWDLVASGPVSGGGKAVLCVECKTINFQPSQFATLLDRRCSASRHAPSTKVLAMPRVSPRMAALCRAGGWSWYDLAGNCRLEIPGVLLIERSGKQPIEIRRHGQANLGTPEAARIVRALLAPQNAGRRWTQRGMVADFAKPTSRIPAPSLALVNKVVRYLRDQAFLEELPNRGFHVRDHESLLQAWRAAYRFDRHGRLRYFTLLHGRALREKLNSFALDRRGLIAYAAFSAAELQAPAVRQPRTWLYVNPSVEAELRSVLDAKTVDSGENLVVQIPDDPGVFYELDAAGDRIPCTNVVQTYVDLVHAGGRGEEAAEAILQRRLRPAWSAEAR